MSEIKCFSCGNVLDFPPGNVGRTATCPKCSADIRTCRNCQHFNPNAYNECNESAAERVVEKERANFCDYFRLAGANVHHRAEQVKSDALKKLDDLFK